MWPVDKPVKILHYDLMEDDTDFFFFFFYKVIGKRKSNIHSGQQTKWKCRLIQDILCLCPQWSTTRNSYVNYFIINTWHHPRHKWGRTVDDSKCLGAPRVVEQGIATEKKTPVFFWLWSETQWEKMLKLVMYLKSHVVESHENNWILPSSGQIWN